MAMRNLLALSMKLDWHSPPLVKPLALRLEYSRWPALPPSRTQPEAPPAQVLVSPSAMRSLPGLALVLAMPSQPESAMRPVT